VNRETEILFHPELEYGRQKSRRFRRLQDLVDALMLIRQAKERLPAW